MSDRRISSSGASNVQEKRGGTDPVQELGKVQGKNNKVFCNYCKRECNGGITHVKEYLAHVSKNVGGCPLVPDNVKQKALVQLNNAKKAKEHKETELQNLLSVCW